MHFTLMSVTFVLLATEVKVSRRDFASSIRRTL
jgi:hypothetical protein